MWGFCVHAAQGFKFAGRVSWNLATNTNNKAGTAAAAPVAVIISFACPRLPNPIQSTKKCACAVRDIYIRLAAEDYMDFSFQDPYIMVIAIGSDRRAASTRDWYSHHPLLRKRGGMVLPSNPLEARSPGNRPKAGAPGRRGGLRLSRSAAS